MDTEVAMTAEKSSSKKENKWEEHIEKLATPKEKLEALLQLMQEMITEQDTPHFSRFWQCKKRALELFKEMNAKEGALWEKYLQISEKARELKAVLEGRSEFAYEQIELAVKAIDEQLQNLPHRDERARLKFSKNITFSKDEVRALNHSYQEIVFLTAYATQIQALRKELVELVLKGKVKARLFNQLSELGDRVFPERKEKIQNISELFTKAVDRFVQTKFAEAEKGKTPYFLLRQEIKFLQDLAKNLFLTTKAFTQTRKELSASWDTLREWEKERKDQLAKEREEKKEFYDELDSKLAELESKTTEETTLSTFKKDTDEIYQFAKQHSLQTKAIQEKISSLEKPLLEKEEKRKEKAREQKHLLAQEKEQKRKEFEEKAHQFIETQKGDVEEIKQLYKELESSETLEILWQQVDMQASLQALLDKGIDNIEVSLVEKLRLQGKKHLDHLRRMSGASNLDFAYSMLLQSLQAQQKILIDRCEDLIADIEEREE